MRPSTYSTVRVHPAMTTSSRPYLYSTGAPASFKPVYYRVTTKPVGPPRPSSNDRRKTFDDDDYYDYEDDESSIEEPQLMVNQHLRGGNSQHLSGNNQNMRNNLYVRPITIASLRPSSPPRTSPPSTRYTYGSNSDSLRAPPSTRNENSRPSYSSFDSRGQSSRPSYSDDSAENDR